MINAKELKVYLYDENDGYIARINLGNLMDLNVSQKPTYSITSCINKVYFPNEFIPPIDSDNVWTITKLPGPTITVQCNEVMIFDARMSNEVCANYETEWKPTWSKDVSKIMFKSSDEASKYYRPKPLGNERLTHFDFKV